MVFARSLQEFWLFGIKQAQAAIFGGFLLGIMFLTHYWYPITIIHRYDFLFLIAILAQVLLLYFKFETWQEAKLIILFHVVATIMELFKTADHIGSWEYPESFIFGIGNVPLFTGFMYSAVGSYIARARRIFNLHYSDYPKGALPYCLVALAYLNFFSHHFVLDIRWPLIAAIIWVYRKTRVHFVIIKTPRSMSLLLGWFLIALFIWFAENIATFANIWIYPNQNGTWTIVSPEKLTSWFLLITLSFKLVRLAKE